MKKMGLLPKLVIGIILGIIIGIVSKNTEVYFISRIFVTFSSLFGSFLSFIIPCIILGFVAPGIADLGNGSGKLLAITTAIAYVSTIIAGTAAYFIGASILPKVIKAAEVAKGSSIELEPYFTITIDPVMGVMTALVMAFMLGIGMSYIKGNALLNALKDFQDVVALAVKNIIIPLVPVYITGIFVKLTVAGEIFRTLKTFSSVYIILLLLQAAYLAVQYVVAGTISGKNPFKSLKNEIPAYFAALGTQSSAATIPINLECVRKNEVSDEIVDFVVPLCATIHLAGDTITLVLASMGVMLMNGQNPTFAVMFPFILMLGVTMVAAPGIPGGGVMASLGLLQDMLLFTQPQQGLMIALHAAQDSFGTATNVTGDGAIAIIVDHIFKRNKSKDEEKVIEIKAAEG
ncbi:dicarboxylate/amino acid:cation symporter [Clostridium thermopalmarium]|uniref:Serine/threonine transporter SstT n=1 Tax=Clostridium thermopalmarium DSM 5974 TaxID=1121340 RepID=A0A2T0B0D9_9CLOT|nr:dicarboxylate/amino acid:cation symporter [Clostridium thermopalmarium]PRR76985.1 Serine/threonine transporter SstT [Clostridium thermopalmarium DSM 5974]PVZ21206.1 Na+/H+-dicarboxylate symporter [Clostridium thermopalmarium DSM 5974]